MIRDFQPRPPQEERRRRQLLIGSVIGHVLVVLLPLAVMFIDRWFGPEPEIESINIEEMPSVGPEVAPETTRLPPDPDPIPEPPVPMPEPPTPEPSPVPEPEVPVPEVMETVIDEPSLDLSKLQPPKQKKYAAEPKLKLPPVPKTRELTDRKKTKPQTGQNDNPLVPIGPKATAQTHGEKPSNTAQGGPNQSDAYVAKLTAVLKIHWRDYSPSLANVRSDASVGVWLRIVPNGDSGRLDGGKISRSSGNTEMDAAAKRLLEHLKAVQLPKPPDGKPWQNTVNFGTKFNSW